MNKYITEFLGTFFLVLVIGLNAFAGPVNVIAISATLIAIIYAGAHISGAHYNPAVTIAVWVRGRILSKEVILYILAQLTGAVVAAILTAKLFGVEGPGISVITDHDIVRALAAEVLGTFALVFVILNVGTAKANSGNGFYGIAIGFTVLGCAYTLGHFSGGAFNPAVAMGQVVNGGFASTDLWIYLAGSLVGAISAALVFKFCNKEDK